jgi:hypothetical protein
LHEASRGRAMLKSQDMTDLMSDDLLESLVIKGQATFPSPRRKVDTTQVLPLMKAMPKIPQSSWGSFVVEISEMVNPTTLSTVSVRRE